MSTHRVQRSGSGLRFRGQVARAVQYAVEPLERRRLLSTINWSNKGTGAGAGDTDDFNAVYGADAADARLCVQRAIDDWERVISNFNYSGGGNTFTLTLSAVVFGGGLRGQTSNIARNDAVEKKPISATIELDDDAGGTSWYFDPTVGTATVPDDSEFTTIVTPFDADKPAEAGFDFYRTSLHEIGHAMGILNSTGFLKIGDFLVDSGVNDPFDAASELRTINIGGGALDYTLTENGGGHLFEGGGGVVLPTHPNALMNAGRAVPSGTRRLISDTEAELLRDVYSYTITLPSLINTFYANLNTATNVVIVTGDVDTDGNDADVIDLEVDGTAMSFEVNGTDEVIEGAQFTTITVNAGAAGDDVDVDELLSGKNVTVNGDAGNDNISAAQELQDIDTDLDSNFTANGGADTDTLVFNDQADSAGGDDYTLTTATFVKNAAFINRVITYGTMENLIVNGGPNASTYDINSLSSTVTGNLTINAGALNDIITLGGTLGDIDTQVNADVVIHGNGGIDDMIFNDVADDAGTDDSYTLTTLGFDKSSTTETFGFDTVENVMLTAGLADNVIDVLSMSSETNDLLSLVVNGNDGNDDITMGSGDLDNNFAFVAVTVNGQAGADSMTCNDLSDTGADTYTITSTTFDKNTLGIEPPWVYGTIEDVTVICNGFDNDVTIANFLSTVDLTINGNGGADVFHQMALDMNTNWNGNLTINGGGASDTITLDDSGDLTATAYTVTSTTFQVSGGITTNAFVYGTVETFTWLTNTVDTAINITSTAVGTSYTINANDGLDTMNIGSPGNNTDNVDGALTVNGNAGTDALNYNDSANAAATTYTVNSTSVAHTGAVTVSYGTMESLVVNCGSNGDTINVASTLAATPATVNGLGGNDSMIFASGGDWDLSILSSVTYNGGAGVNDLLRINDTGDAGADSYTVSSVQTSKSSIATVINYATIENYTLEANPAANPITVNSSFAAPFRINGNGGADTINVVSSAAGSFVTLDGGTALDNITVNSDGAGTANAHFDLSQDLASLTMLAGGTAVMELNGSRLIDTDALTIAATGKLDLTDNDMIVDYIGGSQLPVVQALINLGRAGGLWNGNGITSSAAGANLNHNTTLGAMEATDYDSVYGAGALFDGVDPDTSAVLVKYTYYGDTDFNGKIDGADYARTDATFNQEATSGNIGGWLNGDSDGNGKVDGADYALIDAAFNSQGAALRPAADSPPVKNNRV